MTSLRYTWYSLRLRVVLRSLQAIQSDKQLVRSKLGRYAGVPTFEKCLDVNYLNLCKEMQALRGQYTTKSEERDELLVKRRKLRPATKPLTVVHTSDSEPVALTV